MPMHDFECPVCSLVQEEIVNVGTLTIPCSMCGARANRIFVRCATHLTTIIPDYPGCKKKRAGYVHTHGDRPATRIQSTGFSPPE